MQNALKQRVHPELPGEGQNLKNKYPHKRHGGGTRDDNVSMKMERLNLCTINKIISTTANKEPEASGTMISHRAS